MRLLSSTTYVCRKGRVQDSFNCKFSQVHKLKLKDFHHAANLKHKHFAIPNERV